MSLSNYEIELFLSSKYRDNYNNTNSNSFKIILSELLYGYVDSYSLKQIMIPNTIYNIQPASFEITDSSNTITVNFPGGNYDKDTILTELKSQLDSQSTDTYTITLVNDIINIQSNFNGFILNPNDQQVNFLNQLGFNNSQKVSVAGLVQADHVLNLKNPTELFIRIQQLLPHIKNRDRLHNFYIPIKCSYGSIIYHQDNTEYDTNSFYTLHNISELNIDLYDSNNELVDLRGSDWSILLNLSMIN